MVGTIVIIVIRACVNPTSNYAPTPTDHWHRVWLPTNRGGEDGRVNEPTTEGRIKQRQQQLDPRMDRASQSSCRDQR